MARCKKTRREKGEQRVKCMNIINLCFHWLKFVFQLEKRFTPMLKVI